MLDHTVFTWINPPLSYQELSSQALGEGVLKSLGIPTPRNPHYQVLTNSHLTVTPRIPDYQVLGRPRLLQQHTTHNDRHRIALQ
jgi:hypothetical protein